MQASPDWFWKLTWLVTNPKELVERNYLRTTTGTGKKISEELNSPSLTLLSETFWEFSFVQLKHHINKDP
jgi:hypothetical protein